MVSDRYQVFQLESSRPSCVVIVDINNTKISFIDIKLHCPRFHPRQVVYPRTDPCGTPNGLYFGHECEPDTSILWYRFDKYELNHRRSMPEIPKCLCIRCKKNVTINFIKHSKKVQ